MRQWIIIGLIALVLIASYFWNRNRNQQPEGETIPPVEEVIQREDGTVVKKVGDTEQVLSAEESEAKKTEIRNKTAQATKAELEPEAGTFASGTVARVVENGTYYQEVAIKGLAPVEKGFFYEVWLEKGENERVSLGRLPMTGTTGELLYSSSQDKSDYTQVVISKEAEDGKAEIGTVVMRGTLAAPASPSGSAEPTATPEGI